MTNNAEFLDFGKHKGQRWTRIPLSYLEWLVNEGTRWAEIAQKELERRGTRLNPTVQLTAHAIDRASLRCLHIWKEQCKNGEGLHSWLTRICEDALSQHDHTETILHANLKLVFGYGEIYPILKSVTPGKNREEVVNRKVIHTTTKSREIGTKKTYESTQTTFAKDYGVDEYQL